MLRKLNEGWQCRDITPQFLSGGATLLKDFGEHVELTACLEERLPQIKLGHDAASAPNIHRLPIELCPIKKLGRSIPQGCAHGREGPAFVTKSPCEAKVAELCCARPEAEENVCWCDVTVHKPLAVKSCEAMQQLLRQALYMCFINGQAFVFKRLLQVTVHEFHDEVDNATISKYIKAAHDIGMPHSLHKLNLTERCEANAADTAVCCGNLCLLDRHDAASL
mmetsp:Transcript_14714/g.29033  ORF Transcript_14714/g.29033 Transcript_14714/m.29033 type:complete len:222 (+) Transcript_14714:653-1318(+)